MARNILAICSQKERHTLAELVADDGQPMVRVSVGGPVRPKPDAMLKARLSVGEASWVTFPLRAIEQAPGRWTPESLSTVAYCAICNSTHHLDFRTIIVAWRKKEKPVVLPHIAI